MTIEQIKQINKLKVEAENNISEILKNLVTDSNPKGIETQLYITSNPIGVRVFSFEITLKY